MEQALSSGVVLANESALVVNLACIDNNSIATVVDLAIQQQTLYKSRAVFLLDKSGAVEHNVQWDVAVRKLIKHMMFNCQVFSFKTICSPYVLEAVFKNLGRQECTLERLQVEFSEDAESIVAAGLKKNQRLKTVYLTVSPKAGHDWLLSLLIAATFHPTLERLEIFGPNPPTTRSGANNLGPNKSVHVEFPKKLDTISIVAFVQSLPVEGAEAETKRAKITIH